MHLSFFVWFFGCPFLPRSVSLWLPRPIHGLWEFTNKDGRFDGIVYGITDSSMFARRLDNCRERVPRMRTRFQPNSCLSYGAVVRGLQPAKAYSHCYTTLGWQKPFLPNGSTITQARSRCCKCPYRGYTFSAAVQSATRTQKRYRKQSLSKLIHPC